MITHENILFIQQLVKKQLILTQFFSDWLANLHTNKTFQIQQFTHPTTYPFTIEFMDTFLMFMMNWINLKWNFRWLFFVFILPCLN
jgi:hypothetical protein